jgi:hypothetical protein
MHEFIYVVGTLTDIPLPKPYSSMNNFIFHTSSDADAVLLLLPIDESFCHVVCPVVATDCTIG